ncbi:MAG: hypothetical protein K0S07_1069 [Chlamydiales bacterium]|jgi:hypothetical protein|nr:hypothetical protein [Chlamydiales bacterium]
MLPTLGPVLNSYVAYSPFNVPFPKGVPFKEVTPLPIGLILAIFKELNLRDQAAAAQVCKLWQRLLQHKEMLLAQVFWLRSIKQSPFAQIKTLATLEGHVTFEWQDKKKGQLLVAARNKARLFIIRLREKRAIPIYLKEALVSYPEEKDCPVFKSQTIAKSAFLSSDQVATASKSGTIALWKIVQGQAFLQGHRQLLAESFWDQPPLPKSTPRVTQLLAHKGHLYVEGFEIPEEGTLSSQWLTFHLKDSSIPPPFKKCAIEPGDDPVWESGSQSQLFGTVAEVETNTVYLQSLSCNDEKKLSLALKVKKVITPLGSYAPIWLNPHCLATKKWVALSLYGFQKNEIDFDRSQDCKHHLYFLICPIEEKKVQMQRVFDIYPHARAFYEILEHKRGHFWISKDFLLNCLEATLSIWHIPSNKFVVRYSIKGKNREPLPIVWAGLTHQALHILWQKYSPKKHQSRLILQTVPFTPPAWEGEEMALLTEEMENIFKNNSHLKL